MKNINYRYERKYIILYHCINTIENLIRKHPLIFREIFKQRIINNIYFDTNNLIHCNDNVLGNSIRNKVTVRWYNNFVKNDDKLKLEIKCKNGLLGYKK